MFKVKFLLIRFKEELSLKEIQAFRGAVIQAVGGTDILFHNHQEEGFRYAYPLIQYKRIQKCAAILCLNEGVEAMGNFFAGGNFTFNLNGRMVEMEISTIKANQTLVQTWDDRFSYTIRKWLPLNQENYKQFQELTGIAEKCTFLEKILIGNILSLSKGLGIHLEKEVICKITHLDEPQTTRYKNVKMQMLDAHFQCNVSLPDFVGLGKGVSIGYGMTVRKYENERKIILKYLK